MNTASMVDALINNKPCVTVIAERYKSQMEAAHFHHPLEADVLEIAHDTEGCVDIIERLTRGKDQRVEEWAQFLIDFVRPRGVSRQAGEVAAMAIEIASKGKNAASINDFIDQLAITSSVGAR